ncbi:MAG: hypothetical protein ACOYLO_00775 [Ferruginibacter sp.]
MPNKNLIIGIDKFYNLTKLAEADEFDKAEITIKPLIRKVYCKKQYLVIPDGENKPAPVSLCMVTSTRAKDKDDLVIASDALVFAFLSKEHFYDEKEFLDTPAQISYVKELAKKAGLDTNSKYDVYAIERSAIVDLKSAQNRAYPHYISIFKK